MNAHELARKLLDGPDVPVVAPMPRAEEILSVTQYGPTDGVTWKSWETGEWLSGACVWIDS